MLFINFLLNMHNINLGVFVDHLLSTVLKEAWLKPVTLAMGIGVWGFRTHNLGQGGSFRPVSRMRPARPFYPAREPIYQSKFRITRKVFDSIFKPTVPIVCLSCLYHSTYFMKPIGQGWGTSSANSRTAMGFAAMSCLRSYACAPWKKLISLSLSSARKRIMTIETARHRKKVSHPDLGHNNDKIWYNHQIGRLITVEVGGENININKKGGKERGHFKTLLNSVKQIKGKSLKKILTNERNWCFK